MDAANVDITGSLLERLDFGGSGRVLEAKVSEFGLLREKLTDLADEFEECEDEHIYIS